MANRISSFIISYSHKDQVSFVPGRQGLDQIRQAVNISSFRWDGGSPKESFLLFIDLQKAFDSTGISYLLSWNDGLNFLGTFQTPTLFFSVAW